MKTVEEIIKAGGGITEFSHKLTRLDIEKPVSAIAVTQWQARGVIPQKYWEKVLQLRDDNGKPVCKESDLKELKIAYFMSRHNL